MPTTTVSRLLKLLNIANLALIADASYYRGFGGYGDAFLERVGPYDANSTAFLKAIEQSNATGVFKLPGYDVTKPFPGGPIDGWTFSITALDLSQPYRLAAADPHDAMMGYSMKLQAPDSLLSSNTDGTKTVNAHDSWGLCMHNWGHPGGINKTLWNNPTNKPLAEDGSCKGFLSDACIAAIEKKAGDYIGVVSARNESKSPFGSMVTCGNFATPDECGEYGAGNAGSSIPSYLGVPIPYLNGSVTNSDGWLFEQDKGEFYNSTKNLEDYWDSMVLNYWPVLTVFFNATIDPDAADYERAKFARMNCVAPNGLGTNKAAFTFSGTTPAGNGNGSGGGGTEADGKKNSARLSKPASALIWTAMALQIAVSVGGWTW